MVPPASAPGRIEMQFGWCQRLGMAGAPQPEQGVCPCLCLVRACCYAPSLLRAHEQTTSVSCATFLPPVK